MVEFNIGKTNIQGDVGTVFFAPIPKEVKHIVLNDFTSIDIEFTGKVNTFGEHAFRITSIVNNKITSGEDEEVINKEDKEVEKEKVEEEKEVAVDFESMTKKELVAYIEENNLDIDTKLSKAKILRKLAEV